MAYVYQEKALERIKKGLRRMSNIVERAEKPKTKKDE